MICIVISGPTYREVRAQIEEALAWADLVELRIDLFESIDFDAIRHLREKYTIPMMFTLRSKPQGGQFEGGVEERISILKTLAAFKPDYLDLEYDLPTEGFDAVSIVRSYHNLIDTPEDLEGILHMLKESPAPYYKIATQANSTLDALRILKLGSSQVIALAMGEAGQLTRILAPRFNIPWTYTSLKEDPPLGQLHPKTLIETYNYRSIRPTTALYGLIGHPVTSSPSQRTHNAAFKELNLKAVYVKMDILPTEIQTFVALAKELNFRGLSVTMPLKEAILPFVDEMDHTVRAIGALNTIVVEGSLWRGYNTDGVGAATALEERGSVKGCRVVLIGAGGASKAIAYELKRRGAHLTILNRDVTKAKRLAELLDCESGPLSQLEAQFNRGYEILIHTTPDPMPIDPRWIHPNALVMDIQNRPQYTPILQEAQKLGCEVVFGYEMFIHQAAEQFKLWFGVTKLVSFFQKSLKEE